MRRVNQAKLAGEGYGRHTLNEQPPTDNALPHWSVSALPLLVVLVVNYIGNNIVTWNPDVLAPIAAMKLPLAAASIKSVIGTWSLIVAVTCGIATACIIGFRRMAGGGFRNAISLGAAGSLLAIMTVASEVGYGNVIASLPGSPIGSPTRTSSR